LEAAIKAKKQQQQQQQEEERRSRFTDLIQERKKITGSKLTIVDCAMSVEPNDIRMRQPSENGSFMLQLSRL
jgi:uncharacterized protein (DUF362 family)